MPDLVRSQDDFLGDLLKRIRKLEVNAVSVASPVVSGSIPGGVGNFEVTNLFTVDNLQVFKDTGNILLYSGGHTTPTNVAVPTGDYINVFASKISPLDHVTVMSDPILFFDQGILIEKDVETFGAFMSSSDPYKGFGGGAVMLGHGFENVSDPPRLSMTDNGFHELAITAGSSLVGGVWSQANLDAVLADVRLRVLTSKAATGTPPINVASTTLCTNLNADKLDGYHASDFSAVDVNGYISIAGIHFGSGYPDLYRNIVNSVKFVECSGNVIIDGSLNVGNGLAVTGAIANTGYITTNGSGDVGSAFQILNSTKTGLGTDWRIYNMTGGYGDSLQFWCYGGTGWGAKFILYDNGAWATNVSKTDIYGSFFCSSINFNGLTETGYPVIGRNLVSSTKLLECTGDMIIDGNMTVGTVAGGLSVTGTIASSGSYFQIGSGAGAMRLAKTTSGVISIQEYVSSSWLLGTLNVGILFVDLINSATSGGIFLGDHLRFSHSGTGVKLYDITNAAPANYFLATNSSGYPVWVPSTSTWNGGTVTNPTIFSYNANVYSDINVYGCFRAVHQYSYAGALTTFISSGGTLSAKPVFTIMIDGKHWWGAGVLDQDTNLYRNAAGELKTDNAFTALGYVRFTNYLNVGGVEYNVYIHKDYSRIYFGNRTSAWDASIGYYSTGVLDTNTMLMHGDCIVANNAWYNVYIEGLAPVIHFGDRTTAWDTALARPSANVLCLNGAFEAYDPAGTHDTASYGFLGVTRTADNANNSYIVMTKQSTCVWGLGINNTNDLIIGYANSGKTITPRLTMTLDGNATLSGSLTIAGNFNISGEGHKTLAIPYDIVINTYMPSWGANATRPWILHGWNSTYDDFMSICATGNGSNVNKGAVIISQHGIFFGYGSNDGQSISTQWAKIDSSGNLTVAGSIGDSNGAVWCASINYNGGGLTGFPILGRNTISSIKVVECTGSMVIDGDLTVGSGSGGLSVSGTIASTGSYFQIGSSGSGAMRLAKTSPGVFSVQSYNGTSWLLGTLNAGIVFVDLINSATAGGIFVGDHLRLYSGSAAVKLYDSTNSAPANYYLSTNSSGYPVWVAASTLAWNGGTVANNISIAKTQPYLDFYYGGVREWKVGMLDSGSATFSIIEQAGSKGLNIDGNGLITVFGSVTSQGYLQTTLNSQVLPATTNGMCMLWNFTGGHAEADFFNTYELSNASDYGGFRWYQKLTSSTYLQLASIDTVGNLRIAGCYWLGTIAGLYRYGGNSTVVGGGDNGYFNDDGSVTLGKSDYTKTVAVRGYLFPTEIRSGSGGNLGTDDNQLWAGNAQAADGVELYFNYNSYLKGLSYFRDFVVCNGKGGRIATFSGAGNYLKISNLLLIGSTTRLYNSASRVLQVQDENGALATLDASNIFTDHLNSATGGGIYIMDVLRAYTAGGVIVCYDDFYAHGTYLTYGWKSYADATHSEISDDTASYFGLMLVGNSSGGGGVRRVKVWDELTVNGSQILTGNLFLYGTAYCNNDVFVGYGAAADAHIHRANVGVLQVLDANGALGTWEASNIKADHWTASTGSEMYFMNHMRAYSALNIMPNANNSGNIGGNGAGTNYYWGAVYANYLEYHTSHGAFDALDDLALVKNYKVKTAKIKGVDQEVIDDESLLFLKNEEGFFEASRSVGFLLGCAKFSALKQDELEQRIADLEEQLKKLKGGA